jgi:TetR/AcrR family transcriptional regulator
MKSSKRRHPDRGRAELLDAATTLFAGLGFDRTSLAAVGEKAGVSRGLPGYFFRDKQRLYQAVMERATSRVRQVVLDTVESLPANRSAEDVLRSFVDTYIDFLSAHPEAVRLLQWEYLNPPQTRQVAPVAAFDGAVIVVKRALRTSGYAGIDARLLMFSVVGMCFFPFGYGSTVVRSPAFVAAYKKHVVRLVLKGIRGKR